MLNIKYTNQAVSDLSEIFELIAKDKPSVAIEYITKLEEYVELLSSNPMMGVSCKNKNIQKDCRILIYENYLIFYQVIDNEILILRIFNSSVNYEDKI